MFFLLYIYYQKKASNEKKKKIISRISTNYPSQTLNRLSVKLRLYHINLYHSLHNKLDSSNAFSKSYNPT